MPIQKVRSFVEYPARYEMIEPFHFVARARLVKNGRLIYLRSELYVVWSVGSYRIATLTIHSGRATVS